jgi:UDP-3-O-acyl-N-acetylglucosamine deacetylase
VHAFVHPARSGSGIAFNGVRATVANALALGHSTCVGQGRKRVRMVEHLLAACSGLGLTDLDVRVEGGELPLLDGSSRDYVMAFRRAGVVRHGRAAPVTVVDRPVAVSGPHGFIVVAPAAQFRVHCLIDLPGTSVVQSVAVRPTRGVFERDLAGARTFGVSPGPLRAVRQRLGLRFGLKRAGGLVFPARERFEFEACRHKMLDLLGDLWLLGRPVRAAVYAFRPGHRLNLEMVRRLEAS